MRNATRELGKREVRIGILHLTDSCSDLKTETMNHVLDNK